MSVSNGQLGNETVLNAAFASKSAANTLTGIQTLANVDAVSGSSVTNEQRQHNSIASFVGAALNGVKDLLPAWASNAIGLSTDDIKTRTEAIQEHIEDRSDFWIEYQMVEVLAAVDDIHTITTEMTGKAPGGNDTTVGVLVDNPGNRAEVRTKTNNQPIMVDDEHIVFARMRESAGVWTLAFFYKPGTDDVAYEIPETDINVWYREVFNGTTRPVGDTTELGPLFGGGGSGGGAGGVNLVENPSAETSASLWDTYADAAGVAPVDGTGGTPNITWTRETNNQGRGGAAFHLTKDAVNRQGQGVGTEFSLERADRKKTCMFSCTAQIVSGTYVNGDLEFFLFDDDTNTMIKGCGTIIQGLNSIDPVRITGFFKTLTTGTAQRLIVHVASTSALAYVISFDDISFGPVPDGVYTPVIGSYSTPIDVVAGTGVVLVANPPKQIHFIQGSGGAVDISVNPQITAGEVIGQEVRLVGRSDTNTVLLEDGSGLSLNGSWTAEANSVIDLFWDGAYWVETNRR